MFSATSLMIGVITGAVGMGYFIYGKRQERISFILSGIALCVYSYLFDSAVLLALVGLALAAAPFLAGTYSGSRPLHR